MTDCKPNDDSKTGGIGLLACVIGAVIIVVAYLCYVFLPSQSLPTDYVPLPGMVKVDDANGVTNRYLMELGFRDDGAVVWRRGQEVELVK